jgi:hypothetical protein
MRLLGFITAPRCGWSLPSFSGVLLLLFICLAGTASQATPVLDQVSDGTTIAIAAGISSGNDKAQTFTVGLTGYLTEVDLKLFYNNPSPSTYDVLFDLRTTEGGVPSELNTGANVLFNGVIPASAVPPTPHSIDELPWTILNLGLPIPVTAGEVLSFCLRTDEPVSGPANYLLAGASTYAAGSLYYRNLTSQPTWGPIFSDIYFRTWVDPVPIPPTVILLGSGLAGLILLRWRRGL